MNSKSTRGKVQLFQRKQLGLAVASVLAFSLSSGSIAENTGKAFNIDIAEQSTEQALLKLAEDVGVQIVFPQGLGVSTTSPAIHGQVTLTQALDALLEDTGLVYAFTTDDLVVVRQSENDERDNAESSKEKDVDEEIIVTGSRIVRVPSQMAANVIVLDNKELRGSGETTLEGALRQLPQNIFGATPTAAAVSGSGVSFNGAFNISAASSIDLRGLGAESTLILVNGKRIGKAGVFGGVSDISGIPLASVERVEIMLDGASSVYGSDAVGGVVNVITKKDFEGGEVSYEYASSHLGGFSESVFNVFFGMPWDGGRMTGTFEVYRHSNLDGGEREARITTGGSWTYPGRFVFAPDYYRRGSEIVSRDELSLTYSSSEISDMVRSGELVLQEIFIPPNQDGTGLTPDDLVYADAVGTIREQGFGTSLRPKDVRYILDLNATQEVKLFGQEMNLSAGLYYADKNVYAGRGNFNFTAQLDRDGPDNPFSGIGFFGPFVYWGLPQGFADRHNQTDNEVIRWNVSLDGQIDKNWRWDVTAGQSVTNLDSLSVNAPLFYGFPEFQQLLDDGLSILTGDLIADNPPELLERIVIPEQTTFSVNKQNTFDANINGRMFSLPGGDVYFSLGASWRQAIHESGSESRVDQSSLDGNEIGNIDALAVPRTYDPVGFSRAQQSLSTELLVPIVGSDNSMPLVQQLNLTGQARYDSYQRQGSGSTWGLGLTWNPISQVGVRTRHSTSYVVPTFRNQINPVNDFSYTDTPLGRALPIVDGNNNPTGDVEYLARIISGGNPDLQPETASTLTAGIEFNPDFLPGLTLTADWYHTQYENRVSGSPTIEGYRYISPIRSFGFIEGSGYDTDFPDTMYRLENGSLVYDRRQKNIARVDTSGIDYRVRYNRDTDIGSFLFTLRVGNTRKYDTVRLVGDEPINQVADVTFQSRRVVPAYNYSSQLQWDYRGFGATLDASTRSKTTSTGRLGISNVLRTTKYPLNLSLSMNYDFDEGDLFDAPAWLQGTVIALKIPRLLNEQGEEVAIDLNTNEPYLFGGLNANSTDFIGRRYHISVTKRF